MSRPNGKFKIKFKKRCEFFPPFIHNTDPIMLDILAILYALNILNFEPLPLKL